MAWQQASNVAAGLQNLGNTCFANSVLQCLTHTRPLADYMLTCEHSQNCHLKRFCMMCTMEVHMRMAFSNSGNVMIPDIVINQLPNIAQHFQLGQQEDAHEFLMNAIDKMRNSCIYDIPFELSAFQRKSSNLVDSLFSGSLRSQLVCQNCKYTSDRYEKFFDIALDINRSDTVSQALKEFVKVEILEVDNAYRCSQCNQLVTAKKRSTIHEAPNIVTLSLKRFDVFTGSKLTKKIKYTKTLNIRQYTSSRKKAIAYDLYGVLVHSGYSCQSGHYYSYVRARDDQWYLMNDAEVTPCDIKTVLNQEAYLLFYMRSPTEQCRVQPTRCSRRAKSPDQTIVEPRKKNATSLSKDRKQKPCSNTTAASVSTKTKRKARQDSPMEQ